MKSRPNVALELEKAEKALLNLCPMNEGPTFFAIKAPQAIKDYIDAAFALYNEKLLCHDEECPHKAFPHICVNTPVHTNVNNSGGFSLPDDVALENARRLFERHAAGHGNVTLTLPRKYTEVLLKYIEQLERLKL